jgi:hypothetical protein
MKHLQPARNAFGSGLAAQGEELTLVCSPAKRTPFIHDGPVQPYFIVTLSMHENLRATVGARPNPGHEPGMIRQ